MTSYRTCAGSIGAGLAICLAIAGCNGSTPGGDTGAPTDTGTGSDATVPDDGSALTDAPADMHRLRDTGGQVNLDSAQSNCTVFVTPQTGTATSTYTAMASSLYDMNGPITGPVPFIVTPPSGTAVRSNVNATNGSFSYVIPVPGGGTTFPLGSYTVEVDTPDFACMFTSMFTVGN